MKYALLFFSLVTLTLGFSQTKTIYFDHDSDQLTEESKTIIDALLQLPLDSITVIGHCDSTGSLEYNQQLSERRANATLLYIKSKQADLHVSNVDGKSFLAPKKENSTDSNRAKNRRVEMVYFVTPQQKETSPLPTATLPERKLQSFKCQFVDQKGIFIPKGTITLYNENNEAVATKEFTKGKSIFNDSVPFTKIRVDGEKYFSQTLEYQRVKDYCVTRLQEIKKNSYFTFKNLGFVPNEATLLPSAFPELEGLFKTLESNPRLIIHIEGHTNGVKTEQSPEWHQHISTGRAESVYKYLIDKGIDPKRLTFEGFGCSKMLYPHAINRVEAQENRRVEIKVVHF